MVKGLVAPLALSRSRITLQVSAPRAAVSKFFSVPQPEKSPGQRRYITVGCTTQHRTSGDILVPMIRLRGLWLDQAGFASGETVDVIIDENGIRLVRPVPATPKVADQGELF